MFIAKFIMGLVLCLSTTLAMAASSSNPWTEKPIKLVVGYSAGGPADITARTFARFLEKALKQTIIVENKAGASGMIAANHVAHAKPDGHTLYFMSSPAPTIAPHLQKSTKINFMTDFTYIGKIIDYSNVLVINKNLPFKSVQELIQYAYQHPNILTFGSAGIGSSSQLSSELLKQKTNTEILHIPYRGNALAMLDVISGKISFMFDMTGTAISYIKSGEVRALAVTSKERNSMLPDVPTMIEAGIENYDVSGWYAIAAPKNLPQNIAMHLEAALRNINDNPEFDQFIQSSGYTRHFSDGESLKKIITIEYDLWKKIIEKSNTHF